MQQKQPFPKSLRLILRDILENNFSLDEMQLLTEEMGIDFENIPGQIKSTKSLGLVTYLDRRGQLSDLIYQGNILRPDVDWPEPE